MKRKIVEAYLGLGSNIGDKLKHINAAYKLLEENSQLTILSKSKFYYSKAYGNDKLNDFINSVIKIETSLSPRELLKFTNDVEKSIGRINKTESVYENRIIDVDILFYSDFVISDSDLVIPHIDIEHRDFVLVPLMDVAGNMILPSGKTITDVLKTINNTTRAVQDA